MLIYGVAAAIIVYCLAATFGDIRLFTARTGKGWYQYRVTSRGRDQALFGMLVAASLLFLNHQPLHFIYFLTGCFLGAAIGLVFARHITRKWRLELDRQGSFPLEIQAKARLETSTLIMLLIGLFVLSPLLPNLSQLPSWLVELSTLVAYGLSGFFLSSGIYTWLWGKETGTEHAEAVRDPRAKELRAGSPVNAFLTVGSFPVTTNPQSIKIRIDSGGQLRYSVFDLDQGRRTSTSLNLEPS